MIEFTYSGKPFTTNRIFSTIRQKGKNIRVRSREYNSFKKAIRIAIRSQVPDIKAKCSCFIDSPLLLEIVAYSPSFMTQKGKISRSGGDVDNFAKATIDSIFSVFSDYHNVDDSQVMELSIKKIVSDKEFFTVTIDSM